VEELPSSIGKLSGLHRLVVHGCAKLTRLGDKIGGLVGLRVLDMSDVNVQELPSSIGNLTRCVRLTLSSDCLGGLTSGIGGMVGLRELDLGWSTVNELPSSIGQLPRLEKLDLQHCLQLERLPEEIGNMTGLRELCPQQALGVHMEMACLFLAAADRERYPITAEYYKDVESQEDLLGRHLV
jgi:internalin A